MGFLRDRVARCPAVARLRGGVGTEPFRLLAGPVIQPAGRLRQRGGRLDPGRAVRRPARASAAGQAVRDVGRELRIRFDRRLALAAQHVRSIHAMRTGPLYDAVAPDLREWCATRPTPRRSPSDRPSAFKPAIRSLSSAVRWEYPDMATPFSVSRRTDTSSALGVALHDGTHPPRIRSPRKPTFLSDLKTLILAKRRGTGLSAMRASPAGLQEADLVIFGGRGAPSAGSVIAWGRTIAA